MLDISLSQWLCFASQMTSPAFPLDKYFKDGQLVSLAHASHTTLEESLRSLIRSVESHYSQGKQPNLIFVGTFLDQVKSMVTLDEKK